MDSILPVFHKLARLSRRYLIGIVTVSVCGALGVLTATLSGDIEVDSLNRVESWELPKTRDVVLATDVDAMLAQPLFGGEPVIKEEPETADTVSSSDAFTGDDWRLIGIVTEGLSKHVVIFNDTAGKTEIAKLGQTLPGGEELIAIRENDIEILDTDKRKRLSLFVDTSAKDLEQ